MTSLTDLYLAACGVALALGALLHLAMPLGGPAWYSRFGAPDALARNAAQQHWYPVLACTVIAAMLLVCAGYAFSGAGWIAPWPQLKLALALIGTGLVLRGALFIPLIYFWPTSLARVTNCRSVNSFLITSSLLCLAVGAGYLAGANATL